MPLDAIFMQAVCAELRGTLLGARADKIFMPGRAEAHLLLRAPSGSFRLLISTGARHPRAHLTSVSAENPAAPPMFCMLLRKHLQGARLADITQPPRERVLSFVFDATDELGSPCRKTLVAELMGRHSNLILLDGDDRILDCLVRVDAEMSEARQVLPGLFYHLPPGQQKHDPVETEELERLLAEAPPDTRACDFLLDTFCALPPLVCRELVFLAGGAPDARLGELDLLPVLRDWQTRVRRADFAPILLSDGDKPADFSYVPIAQYGDLYTAARRESFSALLDEFYTRRDQAEAMAARAQDTRKTLTTLRDRLRRKLLLQEEEYRETQNRDVLRQKGDLLMAYAAQVPSGAGAVKLPDFEDGHEVDISLDPARSPQQNAARYYRDYRRAKAAEASLTEQMTRGREELLYLESVLEALSRLTSARELSELRDELAAAGLLKKSAAGKKQKEKPLGPLRFVSSAGLPILAGRSGRQNDILTLKEAAKTDIWLHAQKVPGTHVILRTDGRPPDEASLHEAAVIAVTLSGAREAPKAPVDYTEIRHVKKPQGAKPGMVVYDPYKTLVAAPDRALLERLGAP